MFFTPNLVIGLGIMSLGIALMLDRLGLADIGDLVTYWPVLLVLFGASVMAQSFRPKDSAAPAQKPIVGAGFLLFLLIVTMLASSGFRIGADRRSTTGDDTVNLVGVMSSTRGTSTAPNFKGGRVASVMGRSTLDLRQANVAPGEEAVVDVFVAMGRARIIVPEGWAVDSSALPVMGAVEDRRWRGESEDSTAPQADAPPPPRLVLRGIVVMGKIEIES